MNNQMNTIQPRSAIFLTFNGNCKLALSFYQYCFGGELNIEVFHEPISEVKTPIVVSGLLVTDKMILYGSDLVPNEGRRVGNHMSIFISCSHVEERYQYLSRLKGSLPQYSYENDANQKLIEVIDPFDVRWILGVG